MQTIGHLSVFIHERAKKCGAKPAITFRNFGSLDRETMSWNRFSMRVKKVSNVLLNPGTKPQETIAVFSQNCIHYLYIDYGMHGVRIISTPFYATSLERQIQYMTQDASVKFLLVGEQEQYDKARRIQFLYPTLERVIVFDSSVRLSRYNLNSIYFIDSLKLGESFPRETEVKKRWACANYDDICNILYTSGTTDESKGVILTYKMHQAAMDMSRKGMPVNRKDCVISFLPFSHVFEHGWARLSLAAGVELIVSTYPKETQQSIHETHPTSVTSVLRFQEKVYVIVKERTDKSSVVQCKLFYHALSVGRKRNIQYLAHGERVPLALETEYKFVNKIVLSLVRKQLDLENPHLFLTAGTYVSPEVEGSVYSIGVTIIVGHGLTKGLVTVTCDRVEQSYTVGSAGKLLESINIKISDEGEVMLKGPAVMPGYLRRDTADAEVFDKDGYFHAGDAGYMKDDELFLKEHIRDLFKISNGKYIIPQMVEMILLVDRFIEQASTIADQRKFVSTLIVLEYPVLEERVRENHVELKDREELYQDKRVNDIMRERIETLQQRLASYEKIERLILLAHRFSIENGELTNTLKLKRSVANRRYHDMIEKMYEEQGSE